MRYVTFMTTKRIYSLVICAAWGVPFFIAFIPCLTLHMAKPQENHCMHTYFWVFLHILSVCVCVFLLLAATRIFLVARRHARQNAALVAQLKFNHRIQHGSVQAPTSRSYKNGWRCGCSLRRLLFTGYVQHCLPCDWRFCTW